MGALRPRCYSLDRLSGLARGRAPLAQSAERFHGKEKVVSSILTGGSTVGGCQSLGDRGDVAQSVRALGS